MAKKYFNNSNKKSKQYNRKRKYNSSSSSKPNSKIKNSNNNQSKSRKFKEKRGRKELEVKYQNCFIGCSFVLFVSSILWLLQAPQELVVVLLVFFLLIIIPYLIPLRTHQRKNEYIALSIVFITILIAVLSLEPKTVLEFVKMIF